MSLLNDIKTRLDALGTLGTITIGNMPASPDAVGTLYEYSGRPPERRFGVNGVGYEHPAFQLVFRGGPYDYSGPRTKAEIAYRNLAQVQGSTVIGGATYLQIDPREAPFQPGPIDENNRHRIYCNYLVMKEPA